MSANSLTPEGGLPSLCHDAVSVNEVLQIRYLLLVILSATVAMATLDKVVCYECNEVVLTDCIGCCSCSKWAHKKCAHLGSLPKKDVEKVNWVCTPCLDLLKFYLKEGQSICKKIDNYRKEVNEKLEDVNSKVDSVQETLSKVEKLAEKSSPVPPSPPSSSSPVTYANVAKKHLLVVKSTDSTQKATEKKHEICDALVGVQIADTRFNQSGNVILNFETEQLRNAAVDKVDELDNLSATKLNSRKLFPRIMICNVSTEENRDDLVKTIISRNDYLQSVDGIMDKIKLVFTKDAAGATKHYILKCHPEVRGLIYRKGDEIKLEWGVYKVRARYFATMCYHCLKYGHVKDKCPTKNENPCCKKCAGNHSGTCQLNIKKCINCQRAGRGCANHFAGEMCCPVLNAEMAKIRDMTDHGY